jgi:hypothetical protein
LSWFDLDAQKVQTIDFPARTIEVAPNPASRRCARNPADVCRRDRHLSVAVDRHACCPDCHVYSRRIRHSTLWASVDRAVSPGASGAAESNFFEAMMRHIITSSLVLLVLCSVLHAQTDPLPSWNDGPTKSAIVSFVDRVTKEGSPDFVKPAERIAHVRQRRHAVVRAADVLPVRLRARSRQSDGAASIRSGRTRSRSSPSSPATSKARWPAGRRAFWRMMAATHSGMTTEQFDATVKEWIKTAHHPKYDRPYNACVYQADARVAHVPPRQRVQDLHRLRRRREFMRAFAEETYGIPPEQVVGSSGVVKFEMKDGKPVLMKEPKVEFIDDGPASRSASIASSAAARSWPSAIPTAISRCSSTPPRATARDSG